MSKCLFCTAEVPEGIQVCPNCEYELTKDLENDLKRPIKADRQRVLLRACYSLLNERKYASYVAYLLKQKVAYGGVEHTGFELLADISDELGLEVK